MRATINSWNSWSILDPGGDFTVANIVDMRNRLEELEKSNRIQIAVDFSKVNYLDSSAIGLMMNLFKRIQAKNGKFCVFAVKDDAESILKMVNFDQTVPTYATREQFEQEQGK